MPWFRQYKICSVIMASFGRTKAIFQKRIGFQERNFSWLLLHGSETLSPISVHRFNHRQDVRVSIPTIVKLLRTEAVAAARPPKREIFPAEMRKDLRTVRHGCPTKRTCPRLLMRCQQASGLTFCFQSEIASNTVMLFPIIIPADVPRIHSRRSNTLRFCSCICSRSTGWHFWSQESFLKLFNNQQYWSEFQIREMEFVEYERWSSVVLHGNLHRSTVQHWDNHAELCSWNQQSYYVSYMDQFKMIFA
jgi:hypothetical protein